MIQRSLVALLLTTMPMAVSAQNIDTSVIRAVGAVCGAGLKPGLQSELDGKLTNLFSSYRSANGNSMRASDANTLLETLTYSPDNPALETYSDCVINTLKSIVNVSDAATDINTGRDVIHSNLVPDPLAIMQSGDRFQMRIGDSRAVGTQTLLFSLDSAVEYRGRNYVKLTVSDMMTGQSGTPSVYQGQVHKLNESCSLNPYSIKLEEKLVSFLVICQ